MLLFVQNTCSIMMLTERVLTVERNTFADCQRELIILCLKNNILSKTQEAMQFPTEKRKNPCIDILK